MAISNGHYGRYRSGLTKKLSTQLFPVVSDSDYNSVGDWSSGVQVGLTPYGKYGVIAAICLT